MELQSSWYNYLYWKKTRKIKSSKRKWFKMQRGCCKMRSGRGFEVNIQNFTWSVMALLNNKKSTEPKSIEAYPSKFKLKISTRSKNKQTSHKNTELQMSNASRMARIYTYKVNTIFDCIRSLTLYVNTKTPCSSTKINYKLRYKILALEE